MPLNWIHVEDFSFNCLLLMERFQIRLLLSIDEESYRSDLGIALRHNPAVKWYLTHKCPERADAIEAVCEAALTGASPDAAREAELRVLARIEDFVTYTRPELMDTHCDFIYAWDAERLYELADFAGKTVLDVGSGSGRLAFAAAKYAREVYASEPVDTLREYLREKIARDGITNVRVVDGMAHALAYPDNTFDIVMSGHVVGDDFPAEIAELTRVVKSGGWILDCPGEDSRKRERDADESLRARGWEEFHYISVLGGDVYRYRKRIFK